MANLGERFAVNTWAAIGSADYRAAQVDGNGVGLHFQAVCDGNFELSVLATDLDWTVTSNFVDVSSTLVFTNGAAGGTVKANGFYFWTQRNPGAVRINVTSLQAGKTLQTAVGWK